MTEQRVYRAPQVAYPSLPPVGTVLVMADADVHQRALVIEAALGGRKMVAVSGENARLSWAEALDTYGPLALVWAPAPALDRWDDARAEG